MNVFVCGWLVDTGWYTEDGEKVIVECDGIATGDDRGWTCTKGHSHVYCQYRAVEGWDYASDPGEAAQLTEYGTFPVLMNGTGPFHP